MDVLGELWSSRKVLATFSSNPKALATLVGPYGSKGRGHEVASLSLENSS